MDIKTTTTTFRYRIEAKPGGGFIARAEEGSSENLEGATREEVQQKIDDKLTSLVGAMLHNDKLSAMVADLVQKGGKAGGFNVKVNVTSTSSKSLLSQPAIPAAGDVGVAPSSEPRFESSNKLWIFMALLVAIAAALMYLLKR
ncbi:MAG TPA: hypothetical protein VNX88_22020 [Terriglobales bacterium]|jgi:hypothetical protein|nr:hypothetical protein [Terriglobales bacterium]